jgi:acetyl-CoA carboxylase biotin carboxyl carrier protein
MDFKEIKKLVELVEDAQISHLGLEEDGVKIEIKKEYNSAAAQTNMIIPAANPGVQPIAFPATHPVASAPVDNLAADDQSSNLIEVKAQMVGTFYDAPNPESGPFVKEGDSIKTGQVLCIIEAMKLFNEIESEVNGVVEKVCVKVGSSVEFGQVLFLVKPA